MKIARATQQDFEAALMLLGLLDTVSAGYYPSTNDEAEDDPTFFDEDDPRHLAQLWRRLKACLNASPGFQGRVIGGAHTLMHPANAVIDPVADVLELHPRLAEALPDAERWRFRRTFLREGGAITFYPGGRVTLRMKEELIASGDDEQAAIDAALANIGEHHKETPK